MQAAALEAQGWVEGALDFLCSFPCFSKREQRTEVKPCRSGKAGKMPACPHQACPHQDETGPHSSWARWQILPGHCKPRVCLSQSVLGGRKFCARKKSATCTFLQCRAPAQATTSDNCTSCCQSQILLSHEAQAGPSSLGPSANTRLLSGTPLNLDKTTLPFKNPTLRQRLASVSTARAMGCQQLPRPSKPIPGCGARDLGQFGELGGGRRAVGGQTAGSLPWQPRPAEKCGFVLWEMQQRSRSKRQLWLQASPTHSHGKVT